MKNGALVFMDTHLNRGKAQLCVMKRSPITKDLGFEFQRQLYECVNAADDSTDSDKIVGTPGNGAVRVIEPPAALPIPDYLEAVGFETTRCVERAEALYGKNTLTIASPKFFDLYKEQLVSPLVVFQLFTALLWMLDEYWQFVCFQIFMVLLLESTTVFQRIKTFGTLNGMSSKPYSIQVFRQNKWQEVSTEQLFPGDLISVKHSTKPKAAAEGATGEEAAAAAKAAAEAQYANTVPCDCLILSGDIVVNEATLTGESVPQMKTSVVVEAGDEDKRLDMEKSDRMNVLFSGTSLVTSRNEHPESNVRKTPDGGCLCYVLRTGFSSSQGTFMQMIEYSTHKLSDGSKETGYALLFLLMFALVAAGYVFKKGMEKGDRTTHELLIKCVIIITATVPKQLPMQMAMAVNTALMGLMKNGVFCTEPFRVPTAGKISHCLFDKTGTITTDQLVPVGVVNMGTSETKAAKAEDEQLSEGSTVRIQGLQARKDLNGKKATVTGHTDEGRVSVALPDGTTLAIKPSNCVPLGHALCDVVNASVEVAMVLSSCHSMVDVDGVGLVGDPIEMAALRGIGWRYYGSEESSKPGNWEPTEKTLKELEDTLEKMKPEDKKIDGVRAKIKAAEERIEKSKDRAKKCAVNNIQIIQRHHFESGLQRMSVVAKATSKQGDYNGFFCLVKGSPEAVGDLLAAGAKPEWYDDTYQKMARQGMRVLALAIRPCPEVSSAKDEHLKKRGWVEKDLQFAGFIAFECRARADSGMVIRSLIESAHKVAMATGDAALTALHIAKETFICDAEKETAVLNPMDGGFKWVNSFNNEQVIGDVDSDLYELNSKYNLMMTETSLQKAGQVNPKLWEQLECVQVFARCSPSGKAQVIAALQKQGHFVLMCGDGGNDVGALKQSDVGMALLSGYGNVNADDSKAGENEGAIELADKAEKPGAEDQLNTRVAELKKAGAAAQKLMKEEMNTVKADLTAKQKQWMMDEIERRREAGEDAGVMATMSIMKETMTRMKNELMQAQKDIQRKHGNIFDKDKSIEKMEEDMGGAMMPTVRPGDASVAAPFTSRSPSIKNVVDLIRQGRCTLLSALQNQQIMMLECIISSYCISALSLEGGRSSERQMMASSWLIMIASIAFSYATPIERMSKIQPLRSLFHPAVFLSMLGQAALHLFCLVYAVQLATEEMGPEKLREVVDFHKAQKMIRLGQMAASEMGQTATEDMDWTEWAMATWNVPFLPNLLNTVIFLVETSQMIAVMFVNYKGRPWMKGLLENKPLFLSSFACIGLVVTCAWAVFPWMNEMIHLAEFPNDAFRYKVCFFLTSLARLLMLFCCRLCFWLHSVFSELLFGIV